MNPPHSHRRAWTRVSMLMLLPALAAVLPVIVVLAVHLWSANREAQAEVERLLNVRVHRLVNETGTALGAAARAAQFLSIRVGQQGLAADACQRALAGFGALDPAWSNAAIIRPDGHVACEWQLRSLERPEGYAREHWFARALAGRDPAIGEVVLAGPGGKPVIHVAAPIGDGAQAQGVAVIEIDLLALTAHLGGEELPAGSALVVNDQTGRVVARYPDPQAWIGASGAERRAAFRAAHPSGYGAVGSFDGVERLFLELPVPSIGWHAAIGVPAELAQAPIREAFGRSLLALAAAVAAGALLAMPLARRISRPLHQLAFTAEQVEQGDGSARAPVPDTGELRTVAKQFNRMLDHQQRVERGLRQATSLYEALARANGAVVRGGRFEDIATEVCSACVDSGLALRIAVVVTDGTRHQLVSVAGSSMEEWREVERKWNDGRFPTDPMPLPTALRTGEPVVCNDYLSLNAPAEVLDFGRQLGVRSLAALPLVLDGHTWGAMLVHGDRVGWFDVPRVRLFRAVADDLVHALTNERREAARVKAEQELRARDRQLEGIVETALDAVITVDGEQRIRVFNAAAAIMFRTSVDDALGQPLERYLPGIAPQQVHGRRQFTALRADGTPFPAEASVARHTAGSEELLTAFVRDITSAHAAQQARAAQLAAEAANRAKSLFLAHVSHELRTPIHAILGFNELALHTALTPQQYDYIQKATMAADSLAASVDQILELCNLEAGRFTPAREEFVPRQLAEQVRSAVEQRALARGLAFRVEFDEQLPARVVGDRRRLLQVLVNLAGNAVKFTTRGEVVVRLQAQERIEGRVLLRAAVSDTGIGMSEDELVRVFEPFEQADASPARRYGGTGLGLAISRQVVHLLGGTLAARSTPGAGSEFHFAVWLEVPAVLCLPAPSGGRNALRGRRVLVVDDNAVNLELAGIILRELAGMDVTTADSGEQALHIIDTQDFDVVLMDLQMPRMDGYAAARAILARKDRTAPPILALTAHASDEVRQACLAAGMQDCVGKAGGERALLDALAQFLRSPAA